MTPRPEDVALLRRIEEIEARANAATEGPWRYQVDTDDGVHVVWERVWGPRCTNLHGAKNGEWFTSDRRFIAHAREDVPWLIAQLRELLASRLEGEGRDGERLAEAVLDLWDSRPAVIANDAEYFAHTARQDAKRENVLELARAIAPASSPQPTTTTEEHENE